MVKQLLLCFLVGCCTLFVQGQEDAVWLNPNHGQWDDRVQYKVPFTGGELLVEKTGFTYLFHSAGHNHATEEKHTEEIQFHAVKSTFIGANTAAIKTEGRPSVHYNNYFLGDDPSQWRSGIYSFQEVRIKDFYPGIDYAILTENSQLEYQFFVQPGSNPQIIKRSFEGATKLSIKTDGSLAITTRLGEVLESKPRAFEISGDSKKEVACQYVLKGKVLEFVFPNGYDQSKGLWIDPSLTFSTFTGSTADNWGMTAAPGPNGEAIGGGISFGAGYPATSGAFSGSYNGGEVMQQNRGFDIGISKFNAAGNQLMFSTYIGGSKNELPQSIVCDARGNMYILGITSSSNFPTTSGSYSQSFRGGSANEASGLYFSGTDLYLLKLSVDGRQMLASTLVGGGANDGFNTGALQYNYGDGFRGDVIIDGSSNVYVASNSSSPTFPTTTGSTYAGQQDAVVFKMDASLTTLIWSRFVGGNQADCANSLILSADNRLYVAGGSSSITIPGFSNGNSGQQDGFLMELRPNDGAIVTGRFIGSSAYDQVYFVQTDPANYVYVFGQTQGPGIPSTPGRYSNPNSGQFLQKYEADLSQMIWSTRIGSGSGNPEISPTAFLVSDCYDIFFSGWGGVINRDYSLARYSSTANFPITSDAFQSQTNGSNFYLGILKQNATSLLYGTFMGGLTSSSNHVDGGTSRFDKSGAVYHSVCAACQGNRNGFTTTTGAYATQNPSSNCNMAVFKFQMGLPYALSESTEICEGQSYQLSASGGVQYSWTPSLGLNNPNIANPIANPDRTTVYHVQMDFSEGCSISDSVIVEVINKPVITLMDRVSICQGEQIQLTASGGDTYQWSPNIAISQLGSPTVTVAPTQSMYYYVTVSNRCSSSKDSVWVEVKSLPNILRLRDTTICKGTGFETYPFTQLQNVRWLTHSTLTPLSVNNGARIQPLVEQDYYLEGSDASGCFNKDTLTVRFFPLPTYEQTPDTSVCLNTSVTLNVTSDKTVEWHPNAYTPRLRQSQIVVTPLEPTVFYFTVHYLTCSLVDSIRVGIDYLPVPLLPDSLIVCEGEQIKIQAGGAVDYRWSPANQLHRDTLDWVWFIAKESQRIDVSFSNRCGTVYKSVNVRVIHPSVSVSKDTMICPEEHVVLIAEGALSYRWEPSIGLNTPVGPTVIAQPPSSTEYVVFGTDKYGCIAKDTVWVRVFPAAQVFTIPVFEVYQGDTVRFSALTNGPGVVQWNPTEFLSCVNCLNPLASPNREMEYTVSFVDVNNCKASAKTQVLFSPLIYIPNSFTPDGRGVNELFKAVAGNITNYKMEIFNRWGELVFESHHIDYGWDGTYNGQDCPDGTYSWRVTYEDLHENPYQLVGHVNVLR